MASEETVPNPDAIERQIAESYDQKPGSTHYRAYVGGPRQFDRKAANQFRLLTTLGLRERHHVLEIGCGSLCLGRLLICYLLPQRYFAIEPKPQLWREMVRWELSEGLMARKAPAFDSNAAFDLTVFERRFDFIVASAVFTHTGHDLLRTAIRQMRGALANRAAQAIISLKCSGDTNTTDMQRGMDSLGWHYPDSVCYAPAEVIGLCRDAGVFCEVLPWHDIGKTWFRIVLRKDGVLTVGQRALLDGRSVLDLKVQRPPPDVAD